MKITVKLFGRYKDIAGAETVHLEVSTGPTLRDVVDAFVIKYPTVKHDKLRMMVTKNKIFVNYDTTINNSDEITIAPPVVSGG
jgi:molybdopterin converting factor small subunit